MTLLMPMTTSTTSFCRPVLAVALAGLLLPTVLVAAPARAATGSDHDDTAHCIAVMQTQADDLARQVRTGDKAQAPALRIELERAAALIGRTYLDGLHDPALAKAQLKEAQDAQAKWSDAQRSSLHLSCVKRADAELAAASRPQRFAVERIAQARMQRLLAAP
jgi:hypothetical protein